MFTSELEPRGEGLSKIEAQTVDSLERKQKSIPISPRSTHPNAKIILKGQKGDMSPLKTREKSN